MTPTFQGVDSSEWPAQICQVVDNSAQYVNRRSDLIKCPKYAHFSIHPVGEVSSMQSPSDNTRLTIEPVPVSIDGMLKQMSINDAKLDNSQRDLLDSIHRHYAKVFDNDLKEGYNHRMGRYEVSFVFKESSKPPPLKVWAPQYNKSCQDLLQAKCDQLESQGVLVDPMEADVDIMHLSPIMIQQKGRAKNKKLQDCALEEVRFISCQNVLNDSIKPIPST